MFTLIGTALGFFTSFLPEVLKMFTAKADRKHELDVMDRQAALQAQGSQEKLAAIEADADIREIESLHEHDAPSGVRWIDGLSKSVRPVITYCFFALFVFVEISAWLAMISMGVSAADAIVIVWDDEIMALFSAIISFWFGGRALRRYKKG